VLIVKCFLKKQEIEKAYECLSSIVKVPSPDQRVRIDYELVGVIRAILDLTKSSKKKADINSKDFSHVVNNCLDSLEKMNLV
jgi:ABC-type uncharacterized transport system auxiliary subunit